MKTSIHKIGEQIKKFRELRNYTQESMASKLRMTSQGYGKIERNEVEITIQKLQKNS
jgi:transcriptional regulator with XRE-family HTH domain